MTNKPRAVKDLCPETGFWWHYCNGFHVIATKDAEPHAGDVIDWLLEHTERTSPAGMTRLLTPECITNTERAGEKTIVALLKDGDKLHAVCGWMEAAE